MRRLMLDTCVVVDLLINYNGVDKGVLGLIDDPENRLYASFETMRELIVLYNNHKIRSRKWKSADDIISTVENEFELDFLPLHPQVARTYAHLQLNEEMNHHDPSDHIIISHAISERMELISSDRKFPFYRSQGLQLIEG